MWKFCIALLCLALLVNGKTKQDVLEEKVAQLSAWAQRKHVIKLSSAKFMTYVKSQPRNYSMIVQFTALNPQRRCTVCHEANEEYKILASSYRYSSSYSNKLFFATVDYDDGQEAFQKLGLNSAPAYIHFPAKGKIKKADTYEIQRKGFSTEQVAKWVQERTDVQIRVFRPPNYLGTAFLLLIIVMFLSFCWVQRNSLDFLWDKKKWSYFCIVLILAFTSGQMWNHIRGPPFYHSNPRTGQVSYIHGGTQMQLVSETYIVFAVYGLIVLGFVKINEAFEDKSGEISKRRSSAFFGMGMVVLFFSILLSIFRRKYGSYPYTLMFR